MRRVLTILLLVDAIAAFVLIVQVESVIESIEVAAESLPPIVKVVAKPDADKRQMDYIEHSLVSKRDHAQHVRVVVQAVGLLLLVNAGVCWFVRRRNMTGAVSPSEAR